jgi:hypothetical protein
MLINSELSNFVVFEKPLVFVEPFFWGINIYDS